MSFCWNSVWENTEITKDDELLRAIDVKKKLKKRKTARKSNKYKKKITHILKYK